MGLILNWLDLSRHSSARCPSIISSLLIHHMNLPYWGEEARSQRFRSKVFHKRKFTQFALQSFFFFCTQICQVGRIWRLKHFPTNAKYTVASRHWHDCLFGATTKAGVVGRCYINSLPEGLAHKANILPFHLSAHEEADPNRCRQTAQYGVPRRK